MESVWGALIGDACGATLEGICTEITSEQIEYALTMPGGGMLHVGPGQITDDGELTLALYRIMKDRPESCREFPIASVAHAYAAWYDSCPFDIGRTCSLAFELFSERCPLDEALDEIRSISVTSEANGALMRITPIASWWAMHPLQTIEETAQQASVDAEADASLSHPGIVTCQANAIYVYVLTLLLCGISPADAIQRVDVYSTCDTITAWIEESKKDWDELPNTRIAIGHVRYGFIMSLWFIRHPEIGYKEALYKVLAKGGDTDTNATIVGGIVASYQPIPVYMKERVISFDATQYGRWPTRPAEYVPKYILYA